ncbi:MAG: hypothetical protein LBM68_02635 [Bacteroidales bacterium]|jgi:hypothetical protein|nr:hypothetical protein [Bacteroidales bacterium]
MKEKLKRFDTLVTGIIIGFILPPLTLLGLSRFLTKTLTVGEFFESLLAGGGDLSTNIFIWSLIPVFLFFSIFYFMKFDRAGYGIMIPSSVYCIALVIYNF